MHNEVFCLNPNYSTTRKVTRLQPIFYENSNSKIKSYFLLPQVKGTQLTGGLRTKGYFKNSTENQPLITIVTVVFNGAKYIEETIQSVTNQTYSNIEYLIIDGGSNDETLDIIRKYEDCIDYWVSEKDAGIYDAMNKGIGLASGVLINFMNAGDVLIDCGVIEANLSKFSSQALTAFSFNEYFISENRKLNFRGISSKEKKYDLPTAHNAIFFPTDKSIIYNIKYHICADYDYFLQYLECGYNLNLSKSIYMRYLIGGISEKMIFKMMNEKMSIYLKYHELNFNFINYWTVIYLKIIFFSFLKHLLPNNIIFKLKKLRGYK